MTKKFTSFFGSLISTWFGGMLLFILLIGPAVKAFIFVLKCLLAVVYGISGAPAGWEGPFQ